MKTAHRYELLATLLELPREGIDAAAERCGLALSTHSPEATRAVARFARHVSDCDLTELQGLYRQTFPTTHCPSCMDLGYQLFGDGPRSGLLRVKIAACTHAKGVESSRGLADSLPTVLRLLARLHPEDDPRALADEVVLPAIHKMLDSFRGAGNPYRSLLEAVDVLLRHDFGIKKVRIVARAPIPPEPIFTWGVPAGTPAFLNGYV